jgi:hypothetical protein
LQVINIKNKKGIMKNLILILITAFGLMLCNVDTKAQSSQMTGSDTVTNTATVNLDANVTGDYHTISFQLVATKVNGTPAGTVIIQASNDGTNYFNINTTGITTAYADTFTVTNVATQTYPWVEALGKWKYYRLKCTGSGTSNYIVKGYIQPRKD